MAPLNAGSYTQPPSEQNIRTITAQDVVYRGVTLYETYEPESPLHIRQTISGLTLDTLPFFRLTEEFLKIIDRDGQIKLTPLGALPKKILTELYNHRLILEEGVETGIHKLTKEADSVALSALHYNTVFSGLLRKAHGKLKLTKEGTKLLTSESRNKLFLKTLHAYTEKLAWSNMDGYPAMPIGNLGWGFTIYLLLRDGDVPHEAKYYASKYLKAFPEFFKTFPQREHSNAERDLTRCYCLRTFDRFLEWWGFIESDQPRSWLEIESRRFITTPALREVFQFEN